MGTYEMPFWVRPDPVICSYSDLYQMLQRKLSEACNTQKWNNLSPVPVFSKSLIVRNWLKGLSMKCYIPFKMCGANYDNSGDSFYLYKYSGQKY